MQPRRLGNVSKDVKVEKNSSTLCTWAFVRDKEDKVVVNAGYFLPRAHMADASTLFEKYATNNEKDQIMAYQKVFRTGDVLAAQGPPPPPPPPPSTLSPGPWEQHSLVWVPPRAHAYRD
jgi:hypothetical protein